MFPSGRNISIPPMTSPDTRKARTKAGHENKAPAALGAGAVVARLALGRQVEQPARGVVRAAAKLGAQHLAHDLAARDPSLIPADELRSLAADRTAISMRVFGTKSTTYSAPR